MSLLSMIKRDWNLSLKTTNTTRFNLLYCLLSFQDDLLIYNDTVWSFSNQTRKQLKTNVMRLLKTCIYYQLCFLADDGRKRIPEARRRYKIKKRKASDLHVFFTFIHFFFVLFWRYFCLPMQLLRSWAHVINSIKPNFGSRVSVHIFCEK